MWGWLTASAPEAWDPLSSSGAAPDMPVAVALPSSPRVSPFHAQATALTSPRASLPLPPSVVSPRRVALPVPAPLPEFEACCVAADYAALPGRLPRGMHVLPSLEDARSWHATLFVVQGPFGGGVFECVLRFEHYPAQPPSVVFSTRVFHPLVHPATGAVAPLVWPWTPLSHRAWHVLQALHEALLRPQAGEERTLNADADKMLQSSPDVFGQFAQLCAKESALKVQCQ